MIKKKPSCIYHQMNIQYVCTFVDCNYQTRLLCLQCSQINEVLYHWHFNGSNITWVISLLKYHIDELISQAYNYYYHQRNKQLSNSLVELNHYLSCLFGWKCNVIQQNYQHLLEQIGPILNKLDQKEQNLYKNNQSIEHPNSIFEIDNFNFLKIWRKYMMSFALISENEKYLVLGWSKYLQIYQLNDLKIFKYIFLGKRFNLCQFTQNSRRLLVGSDGGLHQYDVNRQFHKIKNTQLKSTSRILVRNIIILKTNIVLINIFCPNPKSFCKIFKFSINNNKMIYKLIFQDDLYLQYDVDNNVIILNNKISINIYQELDKRLLIEYIIGNNLISQVQYIKDNLIVAHCKSGNLLFLQINYKLKQLIQIREIKLIPKLFFYNTITQEIVAQTEQQLITINCHSFEQINIPYQQDEKSKYKNFNQNRLLRQQQNSLNYLITYGRNSIALFKRKQ